MASLALAVLSAPASADATVAVELPRAQLVSDADLVVRVTVLDHRSAWDADNTAIRTWTRLRVTEYLKGSGPSELTVRQIGGEAEGLAQYVPGDPRLREGADLVVFLRRGEGVQFLTAMAQSVFYVERGPDGEAYVRRDLTGLTFARVSPTRPMEVYEPESVSVVETLDQLRASIRQGAGGAR
ncbi:MAG: hypothetical protein R3A48_03165 [Polyangiales bacterium]